MKRYIIAIFALLMAVASQAQTSYKSLLVSMKNGSETEFKFSATPVATFEGADMKISSDQGAATVTMPMADVEKMTVIDDESGLDQVTASDRASFVIGDSEILGAGFAPQTIAALYSLDGILLERRAADGNGCFSLPIPAGAKGTYIVKAGDRSFKFIK